MPTRHPYTNRTIGTNINRRGFTLIEIMVASSIFIIVMFIAVGAILSLVDGNRKAQALSSVVNNLNISLESMVRDLRTGTNYVITSPSSIDFKNSDGNNTTYSLSGTSINKFVSASGINGAITAPEVTISSMKFIGKGLDNSTPTLQPLVLLQIQGTAGAGKYVSPLVIETLISQRVLK